MARCNPTKGAFKPHIVKVAGGRWHTFYRNQYGVMYSAVQVSWMTSNSSKATAAKIWCANRNARIVGSKVYV